MRNGNWFFLLRVRRDRKKSRRIGGKNQTYMPVSSFAEGLENYAYRLIPVLLSGQNRHETVPSGRFHTPLAQSIIALYPSGTSS